MNTWPNWEVPGGTTVRAALPVCPSLVAVMVAVPAATPVTSPLALTFATAAFERAHVTVRPASALPFASFGVAVNCSVPPTGTLADAGLTVTDATGTGATATVAVPLYHPLGVVIG